MDNMVGFLMQMRQCRRLAEAAIDMQTFARLNALALEFEAKAKAAYARAQPVDLGTASASVARRTAL